MNINPDGNPIDALPMVAVERLIEATRRLHGDDLETLIFDYLGRHTTEELERLARDLA